MDVGLEVEDDVFFADLNKQIALLIMDDEHGEEALPLHSPSSVSFQASPRSSQRIASPVFYQQACGGMVGGTGVFIPRTSLPRRERRSGRPMQPRKCKLAAPAVANTIRQQQQQQQQQQQPPPPPDAT